MLVASEKIAAGAEIRINHEKSQAPPPPKPSRPAAPEYPARWRAARTAPPPSHPDAEPLVDGLARLQRDAGLESAWDDEAAPAASMSQLVPEEGIVAEPIPWEGGGGGDARMRQIVPPLSKGGPQWAIVATHMPGRSGRECRDRWLELVRTRAV